MNEIWIGTNWKMTKTIEESLFYTKNLIQVSKQLSPYIKLFIIPSFTALAAVKKITGASNIYLGAQNMHWEEKGPYTGEISPIMLNEIGINIVELGHSERREYFNENNQSINKKAISALKYNMKPLICIGESLVEKNNHISQEVLAMQLKTSLKDLTEKQIKNVMIAYEPVWAIGEKGLPATADYIENIHNFLRKVLYDKFGKDSLNVPLLYGGSVNRNNFEKYLKIKNVDGLFIGRSAWDIDNYKKLLFSLNSHFKN